MQKKLIEALADVLGVDLRDLQGLSETKQLATLEQMQAKELLSI